MLSASRCSDGLLLERRREAAKRGAVVSVTRAQIVAEARSFKGTPYQDKGRMKGRGLDCVGLPLMVAGALGLKDKDGKLIHGGLYTDYSSQPLADYVHQLCMKHLVHRPVREAKEGDVVSVAVATAPCHVGILGRDDAGNLTLIHAFNSGKNIVIEQPIDEKWRRRLRAAFKFPEVTD